MFTLVTTAVRSIVGFMLADSNLKMVQGRPQRKYGSETMEIWELFKKIEPSWFPTIHSENNLRMHCA